jgi:histidine phosphotransfer protein HptB
VTEPIDAIAFANLLDITGGDVQFVDELVDTYLDDGQTQVDALDAALAAGDVASMGRTAHALKSSSLSVGALQLGELCRGLETAARSGDPVPEAADRVESIRGAFATARTALLGARLDRPSG